MTASNKKISQTLELFSTISKLKDIKRAGWALHGIQNGESVADHSFQVAIMAMSLAHKVGVDQDRSVLMALLHDIGESVIGDVITERGGSKLRNHVQKHQDERNAVRLILNKAEMDEYLGIFDEYVAGETPEAQFVRQLDKLEMAIQARKYELSSGIDLGEFYVNARKYISNQVLLDILDEVDDVKG